MENSEARVADAATPGQRLRDAREAAGISPREMADRLNWLPTYVAAIEEDRYESMRSPAFVRGYLRAYARALGLNADELVAGFDALLGGGVEEREMVLPTSPASNQKTGLSVIMGTIIAVLVIGFLWWQGQEDEGRPAGQAAEDRESAAASAAQTASAMSASANSARDAAAKDAKSDPR